MRRGRLRLRHAHSRQVTDDQLLEVLNVLDDGKATFILDGELSVGSYKAALAACKVPTTAVLNCAGKKLRFCRHGKL